MTSAAKPDYAARLREIAERIDFIAPQLAGWEDGAEGRILREAATLIERYERAFAALENLALWSEGGNDKLLGAEGGITKDEFAHAIAAHVAKIIASRLRRILADAQTTAQQERKGGSDE